MLTGTFLLFVSMARLQPDNNTDIQALLLPPAGCPVPCFLGVRPGWTTSTEAISVLEAHQWIDAVDPSADFLNLLWSGSQPTFVDTTAPNYLFVSMRVVAHIRLRTTLRLGDVWVTLGQPEVGFSLPTAGGSGFNQYLIYKKLGFEVGAFVRCSAWREDLWRTPIEIRLHNRPLDYSDSQLDLVQLWKMPCS